MRDFLRFFAIFCDFSAPVPPTLSTEYRPQILGEIVLGDGHILLADHRAPPICQPQVGLSRVHSVVDDFGGSCSRFCNNCSPHQFTFVEDVLDMPGDGRPGRWRGGVEDLSGGLGGVDFLGIEVEGVRADILFVRP